MDTLHDILHSLIAHFIPHEGNDYRPHLLQKVGFLGLLFLITLSFAMANFQAFMWQSSQWLVSAVLPAVVVELTNVERTENSLPVLTRSATLDAAATLKAQDMAKHSYFSHDSPTGVTPWYWFDAVEYSYTYAGENLAVYFTDSTQVVEAWMDSPTHRANIVGSQYREIGVGTAKGTYNGFDTVFVVQLFGSPAVPAPVEARPVAIAQPPVIPGDTLAVSALSASGGVPQVAGEAILAPTVPADRSTESVPNTPEVIPDTLPETTPVVVPEVVAELAPPTELVPAPPVVPEPINVPVVEEALVWVESGVATSMTNLPPAAIMNTNAGTTAPLLARLATQPNSVLQLIYLVIGFGTMMALFASVLLEWQKHRPLQTVYGVALLLLMCGLFYLHSLLTVGALVA